MALTEEEKHSLQITEADLKNQTAFFPMIATFLLILVSVSVYFYHAVEKYGVDQKRRLIMSQKNLKKRKMSI